MLTEDYSLRDGRFQDKTDHNGTVNRLEAGEGECSGKLGRDGQFREYRIPGFPAQNRLRIDVFFNKLLAILWGVHKQQLTS